MLASKRLWVFAMFAMVIISQKMYEVPMIPMLKAIGLIETIGVLTAIKTYQQTIKMAKREGEEKEVVTPSFRNFLVLLAFAVLMLSRSVIETPIITMLVAMGIMATIGALTAIETHEITIEMAKQQGFTKEDLK